MSSRVVCLAGVEPAALAASAVKAMMPPSPRLFARRINTTYFSVTTTINAHRMVDTAPMMFAADRSNPCNGLKTSFMV